MPQWESVNSFVRCLRAGNPGPMTLDGTNSYVLAAPHAAGVVVIDPGPLLEDHLVELAASGAVELILITHRHADHTAGSARLHELTGAPVRAALAQLCHQGATLDAGELLTAGGLTLEVLATPGHTSDSLCFAVQPVQSVQPVQPGQPVQVPNTAATVMFTGDTILGSGSTVLDYPDGTLQDYLESLAALRRWAAARQAEPVMVLPGHGPVLADLNAAAQACQAHRAERIAQVRAAVERLGAAGEPTAEEVTAAVYGDLPEQLQAAALLSVQAQLQYLL